MTAPTGGETPGELTPTAADHAAAVAWEQSYATAPGVTLGMRLALRRAHVAATLAERERAAAVAEAKADICPEEFGAHWQMGWARAADTIAAAIRKGP